MHGGYLEKLSRRNLKPWDISSFSHAPYEKAAKLLFSLFVGKVLVLIGSFCSHHFSSASEHLECACYDPLTLFSQGGKPDFRLLGGRVWRKKEVFWPELRPLAKMAPHAFNSKTSSLVLRTSQGYL